MFNFAFFDLIPVCFKKILHFCYMLPALVIATRFIELGIKQKNPVTPMKLQKLVYLAHGIHLARFNSPLIDDDIEAWDYGPVIRSVYDEFKVWGNRPITDIPKVELRIGKNHFSSIFDMLTDAEDETINLAWEIAKDLTGPELSNWSHSKDSPWHTVYTQTRNKRINREIIRDYFLNTMKIREEA